MILNFASINATAIFISLVVADVGVVLVVDDVIIAFFEDFVKI